MNDSQHDPDLLLSPHIVPLLMELLAGKMQGAKAQAQAQHAEIVTHLATCQYCRTACRVLLTISKDADSKLGMSTSPADALLARFAAIEAAVQGIKKEE